MLCATQKTSLNNGRDGQITNNMKNSFAILTLLLAGSAIAGPLLDPGFSLGFQLTVIHAANQNGGGPGGGAIPFKAPFYVITDPVTGVKTTNAVVTPFQNFPNKP